MEYDNSRKKNSENRQEIRYHEIICRKFAEMGCKKDTGSQTASQTKRGRSIKAKVNSDAKNIPTPAEAETKHTIASRTKPPHHIPQSRKLTINRKTGSYKTYDRIV